MPKRTDFPPAEQIDILTHLSDSIGQANTEFFIWPETAIAAAINEDKIRDNNYFLQVQHFLDKFKNGNVITGAETYKLYDSRKTKTASPTDNPGEYCR